MLWEHQRHIDLNRLSWRSQIERIVSEWTAECRQCQCASNPWNTNERSKKKKDWISFTNLKTVFGIKFTLIICEPMESVRKSHACFETVKGDRARMMPKVYLVGLPLKVAQRITGMGQYHGGENPFVITTKDGRAEHAFISR